MSLVRQIRPTIASLRLLSRTPLSTCIPRLSTNVSNPSALRSPTSTMVMSMHPRTFSTNSGHGASTSLSAKQLPDIPLFRHALQHLDNTAIYSNGQSYTYKQLLHDALCIKQYILHTVNTVNNTDIDDITELSVSYLIDGSYEYVAVQWGVWLAGGIGIPLHTSLPPPQQQYIVSNSESRILFVQSKYYENAQSTFGDKIKVIKLDLESIVSQFSSKINAPSPHIQLSRRALLIYTSGTTGQPKGVVSTHRMLDAQISSLVKAWEWTEKDAIVHVLPLHHVHGVINALACPLFAGAAVHFMTKFDPAQVWQQFVELKDLTVFTAVPTIYSKLIQQYESVDKETQQSYSDACKKFRLFMCGSAALPSSTMDRWKQISGHTLLERYGMTECGMALANSYTGERKIGYVGQPLPGVKCKIDDGGQLLLKGDNVFSEYWNLPDATKKEFTEDGWFKTGDIVEKDDSGNYKIVGRASVDIIKSAGNKVSSLEIEQVLLTHDKIEECAVVGVPDDEYGQLVSLIAALKNGESLTVEELRQWCKSRLQTAEIPRKLLIVDSIPRNAMGKVNKKQLVKLFDKQSSL